jgi:transcriptional regulator with XRE-family HTH domain
MAITGPQCRAARALVQWSREELATASGVGLDIIASLETGREMPPADLLGRLQTALEEGGAVFIPESGAGGAGVRLKFNSRDVRAINRLEGEGGSIGEDDV